MAGVALAVATAMEVALPPLALLSRWGPPAPVGLPHGEASPQLLPAVYERLLPAGERRRLGAHHTPPQVASGLVRLTFEATSRGGGDPARPSVGAAVLDPACGAGALLLAAAEELASRAGSRDGVVAALVGLDVDPVAAAVAEAALALWSGGTVGEGIRCADALTTSWPEAATVVANPPFLGQLVAATARLPVDRAELRRRWGPAVTGYVDTAAIFLLAAADHLPPGGCAGFVVPEPLLAARDAQRIRAAVAERADVVAVWQPGVPVFEAAARPCVLVIRRHPDAEVAAPPAAPSGHVLAYEGLPPRLTDGRLPRPRPVSWSPLLSGAAPKVDIGGWGTLGDVASATAGFREEYYGLAPHVVDAAEVAGALADRRAEEGSHDAGPGLPAGMAPLVTTGLVDPVLCHWGLRPARFKGRRWRAPAVDLAGLDAADVRLAGWVRARLVPKLVVATQTRVVEAAVDEQGHWVPLTPLIAVTCPPDRLWHAAAALLSPPVTAWAVRTSGGGGLSAGSFRLRAAQVLEVPLPAPSREWDQAAAAVRAASAATAPEDRRRLLLEAAAHGCAAYRLRSQGVLDWWGERLPSG